MPPSGNVLFITLDQWRGDCLSAMGHPCLKTPVLDALAADGVLFASHFAQASPCGPSRASLYTGMYLQNHRVCRNGTPLDTRHTNIALEAARAGYEPVLFGYTDTSDDPRGQDPGDPRFESYEGVLPGMNEKLRLTDNLGPWLAHLEAKGHPTPAPDEWHTNVFRPVADYPGAGEHGPSWPPPAYPAQDSLAAFMTGEIIDYLEARQGEPWFVHASYWQPHPPFTTPEPYNTRYDPAAAPPPRRAATPQAELEQHPLLSWCAGRMHNDWWIVGRTLDPADMTDAELAQLRATYWGMINEVEDNIARLVDWLKANGQYNNTLIVMTSDHGEQLGDHWVLGKEFYFDESFHIPLIVRDPRKAADAGRGRKVDAFTESVDIMPTILDWLGLDTPRQCDGVSLAPWLAGETPAGWRDAAHWEYDFRDVVELKAEHALGLHSEACQFAAIRDRRYKYVHFPGLPPLFFDLEKDPDQLVNLAENPDYAALVLQYASRMLSWRMMNDERVLTHTHIGGGVFERKG
ncbi:MAG: alkaline phosphatase family protein [Alphaproteobacteria bacterium]